MLIWIIVTLSAFPATFVFLNKCCDAKNQISKKRFIKMITLMLLCAALFATSFITILQADSTSVRSANRVALIYDDDPGARMSESLYYDEATNEYFTIKYNYWNVFRVTDRQIVDNEVAENYIKVYEQLHSFNLK